MNTKHGFGGKQGFGFGVSVGGGFGSNISVELAQALINYANDLGIFQYGTDISGNAILVNQGTGDDGLLNTGRAIELVNGVNDVTISGDYITWFDFADNQFYSATTSKTFTGITTNAILTHKTAFDAQSLANLNANPQLIAELGINGSSTELNVTLDATDAFYACSEESGGSLVNQRSVVDTEDFTFDTDLEGFSDLYGNGGIVWENGRLKNEVIVQNQALARKILSPVLEANTSYIAIVDVDATEIVAGDWGMGGGRLVIGGIQVNFGEAIASILVPKGQKGTAIGFFTTGTNSLQYCDYLLGGTVGDIGYLDRLQIKKATAQEITNYTETVRTNVKQNTAGLQTTCMELDGAGVPIAYDLTKLHIYSDGFIDTQWTWTTGNTITENTVEYATTTKTMPYQIDDLSADGTTSITAITDFKVEE